MAAALLAGCGGSSPQQADLADVLHGRYGLTRHQATCVARGVFRHFHGDDLRRLRSAASTSDLSTDLQKRLDQVLDQIMPSCQGSSA